MYNNQTEEMTDFENLKDNIVFKLVNREFNASILMDIPHIPYTDMEIVFAVLIDTDEDGKSSFLIRNEHLELWRIRQEDIYDIAMLNTEKLLPSQFKSMEEVLCELTGEEIEGSDNEMYVLSNADRCYGAAVLLYPDKLKEIADILQDDYFVLPSSVHEVIIIPKGNSVGQDELTLMVQDVNATQLKDDEVLSNHAYLYSRNENVLF